MARGTSKLALSYRIQHTYCRQDTLMSKPHIHAQSSAKHFGGKMEDYLDIHEFLDSSKQAFSDLRHRALTHHPWFISNVLPRIFGGTRTNSDGKRYSVVGIGELHVLEDFGGKFIPSAQDYLEQIEMQDWMDNGKGTSQPSSHRKLGEWQKVVHKTQNPFNEPDPSFGEGRCGPRGAID